MSGVSKEAQLSSRNTLLTNYSMCLFCLNTFNCWTQDAFISVLSVVNLTPAMFSIQMASLLSFLCQWNRTLAIVKGWWLHVVTRPGKEKWKCVLWLQKGTKRALARGVPARLTPTHSEASHSSRLGVSCSVEGRRSWKQSFPHTAYKTLPLSPRAHWGASCTYSFASGTGENLHEWQCCQCFVLFFLTLWINSSHVPAGFW